MRWVVILFTLLLIIVSFSSCRIFGYIESPNEQFIEMLNNKSQGTEVGPLLSGIYTLALFENSSHIIDSIHIAKGIGFISPLIFYGNNLISRTGQFSFHSMEWESHLFNEEKEFMLSKPWGVYKTENEVIKAICYVSFRGNSHNWDNRYLCYFEGRMEGRTKIVDWHIIPPFPDLKKGELEYSYNQRILTFLKAYKTYEYRPFPMKTNIDSTKIWINQFRNSKVIPR